MQSIKATEETGIELLYRGQTLDSVPFHDIEHYNKFCDDLELDPISNVENWNKDFCIPERYKTLEVDEYIRGIPHADGPAGQARVELELELFRTRNLFPILQTLIYIVDTMHKNNIVWGVGRGSSVASYCLYLIGIHRINSLKYNLDIHEFLK
jgi:hypothetical protein